MANGSRRGSAPAPVPASTYSPGRSQRAGWCRTALPERTARRVLEIAPRRFALWEARTACTLRGGLFPSDLAHSPLSRRISGKHRSPGQYLKTKARGTVRAKSGRVDLVIIRRTMGRASTPNSSSMSIWLIVLHLHMSISRTVLLHQRLSIYFILIILVLNFYSHRQSNVTCRVTGTQMRGSQTHDSAL